MILLLTMLSCRDKNVASPDDTTTPDTDSTDSGLVATQGCLDAESPALSGNLCVSEAPCSWSGEQSYEYFGYALDSGEDLDGDGFDEIVAGSLTWDSDSLVDSGRAVVIAGGQLSEGGLLGSIGGTDHGDYLGSAVALIPDATGDGLAELLVGANGMDDGETVDVGAAVLVGSDFTPIATMLGERSYARAGSALAGSDLDGDGLAELLITGELKESIDKNESYAIGRVYVVSGRTDSVWPSALADAGASLSGETDDDAAGQGLASADLDGDGYPDLIIGAPYAGSYTGRVYVLPGGAGFSGAQSLSDAPIQLDGATTYDAFGWAVTGGDLTGDGAAELIVGAPLANATWGDEGSVSIYAGGADFFSGVSAPLTTIIGERDDFQLGTGLDASGDVDSDGIHDLLMGGVSAYSGLATKSGRSYLLLGRSSGLSSITDASQSDALLFGAGTKDYVGRANAMGDVDGDGAADVVIGSGYANIQGYYDVGQLYLFFGGS